MLNRLASATPGAVLDLARRGDHAAALRLGEKLLRGAPRDPRLDHLVGVVACQAGAPARGAELLARALAAQPGKADIRFNFARALGDSGEAARALTVIGEASEPRLQLLRATLLKQTDRTVDAVQLYRDLARTRPDDPEVLNNLGTALLATDDPGGAHEAFEAAIRIRPGDVTVLRNLARALQVLAREPEALAALRQAHGLDPSNAGVILDFGQALNRLHQPREALEVLADAVRLAPGDPEVFSAIGLAYGALAEFDAAEEAYFHALQIDPVHPQALLNLGVLLEQSNRIDQLRALIDGARARGAEGDELDLLEVIVLRRDGRFAEALALARGLSGGRLEETTIAQTIAQLADRLGATGLAFAEYTKMNAGTARTPAGRTLTGAEYRCQVEAMTPVVTPAWFAGWTAYDPPPFPAPPVFLVGFPRSGTTLLDTVLMGHSRTHVLEEEPALRTVAGEAGALADLAGLSVNAITELRLRYFEEVAAIAPGAGGKQIIDKLPLGGLRAPLIHRLFPDAKLIFALRHPCDAVLSCFMQHFRLSQAMASFLTLENGARFYDATMTFWTRCRTVMPLAVHEVRYEDFVEDQEGVLRPLLDFLGLGWEDAMLGHQKTATERGFIRTPSYAQVTEGIYRRSSGRWERYREHVEPVLGVLAPWAVGFGYPDPRRPAG